MFPKEFPSRMQIRPCRVAGVNVAGEQVAGVGEGVGVRSQSGGAISPLRRSIGLKNSGRAVQRLISIEGVEE